MADKALVVAFSKHATAEEKAAYKMLKGPEKTACRESWNENRKKLKNIQKKMVDETVEKKSNTTSGLYKTLPRIIQDKGGLIDKEEGTRVGKNIEPWLRSAAYAS